jgi:hypothetical protein
VKEETSSYHLLVQLHRGFPEDECTLVSQEESLAQAWTCFKSAM